MHVYHDGTFESISSTIDDVKTISETVQRLTSLGYQRCQELIHRGGTLELYTRQTLPAKRTSVFNYDHIAMLSLGYLSYVIGIADLPDMIQFLKEIDAHPKESSAIMQVEVTNIAPLLYEVATAIQSLERPKVTLTGFAEFKTLLQQVSGALVSMKQGIPLQLIQAPIPVPSPPNGTSTLSHTK